MNQPARASKSAPPPAPTPGASWGASRPATIALLVVLLAALCLAYLPALRGGFIWDDDDYVTQNQTLRNLPGLIQIWTEPSATPQYYPLVHTTFWLEYHLWQLNPVGYHVVNVLLHALGGFLLWRGLVRLQLPGAWLAAALWAFHPVMIESVAWITERKNVLSAAFYFAAALLYLRWALSPPSPKPQTRDPRIYWLALGLFLCALLSKTVTCSLPAALLLVLWWKNGRLGKRDILPLLPFFAVGLASGLLTAYLEKHHVGAHGTDWTLSFLQRGLIAGRALWFYAAKLIYPVNLTFIYPRWEVSPAIWWQWLFPIAAVGVVGALWLLRHRIGRGPLVAVLFFAGTLFPALGFVNTYPMRYSFVADHFQYLAAVGLLALAAAGLARLVRALPAITLVLLVTFGILTWRQSHIYLDLDTLWRDTLRKNPGCWMALNNLGWLHDGRGELAEAEKLYLEALRFNPTHEEALNNMGVIMFKKGRVPEAVTYYRKALQVQPKHPHALNNLGFALAFTGDYPEALKLYETAIQLHPKQAMARINYGTALLETGRTAEAIIQLDEARRIEPDNILGLSNLAKALAIQGRTADAIAYYTDVIRRSPADAPTYYNLAVLLGRVGKSGAAIANYELALRHLPDYPEAHNNLGVALTLDGRVNEALNHFTEALRLKPDYAEAHNNYAYALIQLDRRDEAIRHLMRALEIEPDYALAKKQLRSLGLPVR